MGTIYTAKFDSAIGPLTVASSETGLAYLALPCASGRGLMGWRERHCADDEVREGLEPNRVAIEQITQFLEGEREIFDVPMDLRGTPFQLSVYEEVAAIPYGQWLSYSDVAARVGRPAAIRAVGAANGANPVPLVVPCHRVLARSGQLQGYAGGLELKAKLLTMEKSFAGSSQQISLF